MADFVNGTEEELDLNLLEEVLSPSEFDEYGIAKPEYSSYNQSKGSNSLLKIAMGTGGIYGTAVVGKPLIKHLTPITQAIVKPLKEASTKIQDFYTPATQASPVAQMDLVYKHWKGGDIPGINRYLEKYANARDPFGIYWQQGTHTNNQGIFTYDPITTKLNRDKFRKLLYKHGKALGVETADEMWFKSRIEVAEKNISKTVFGTDYPGKEEDLYKLNKALRRNTNELRYEVQKTELIKNAFGEKVNNQRWNKSGLGKIVHTDLKTALDGNDMSIKSWTKGAITPDTKVTASYLKKDAGMLFKEGRKYGILYDKPMMYEGMALMDIDSHFTKRVIKRGGIKNWAEEVYQIHEKSGISNPKPGGAEYQAVHRRFDNFKEHLERLVKKAPKSGLGKNAAKSLVALDQFLNNYTFKDGVLKVPYSFVSKQKAIAGVNANMTFWRGAGTEKAAKWRMEAGKLATEYQQYGIEVVKQKQYIGTPGKLHYKMMISDIYDVAGAPEAMIKNLHVNVAKFDSRGQMTQSMLQEIDTPLKNRTIIQQVIKSKEYKHLLKILPRASKKHLLRLARLLIFRR